MMAKKSTRDRIKAAAERAKVRLTALQLAEIEEALGAKASNAAITEAVKAAATSVKPPAAEASPEASPETESETTPAENKAPSELPDEKAISEIEFETPPEPSDSPALFEAFTDALGDFDTEDFAFAPAPVPASAPTSAPTSASIPFSKPGKPERGTPAYEQLQLDFLKGARRGEMLGPGGMSTREILAGLRTLERRDLRGTRLTNLSNAIRRFGGSSARTKYEPPAPEERALSTKEKLTLADVTKGLEVLAETREDVLKGDQEAAKRRQEYIKDLLTAATSAMQEAGRSGRDLADLEFKATKAKLQQMQDALESASGEQKAVPEYSPEEAAKRASADGYSTKRTAAYIANSTDPKEAEKLIFAGLEAEEKDKAPHLEGTLPGMPGLPTKATQAKRIEAKKERIRKQREIYKEDRILTNTAYDDAEMDRAIKSGTVTFYVPTSEDGPGATAVTIKNVAELKAYQDKYPDGSIGMPEALAENLKAQLDPEAIMTQQDNAYTAVVNAYKFIGNETQLAALNNTLQKLSGGKGRTPQEMADAYLGLSAKDYATALGRLESQRAKLLDEAPDIPPAIGKKTLQQELARRKASMMRDRGIVTLPPSFDRKVYRKAGREERGQDVEKRFRRFLGDK